MMCGSLAAATIYVNSGAVVAWISVAVGPICATIVVCTYTAPVITSRLKELSGEKPDWLEHTDKRDEILAKTEGIDPEVFLAHIGEDIKDTLRKKNYVLWSGHIQRAIK